LTSLENFIKQKLTLKVFLLVGFFIITIPILFNFDYLLFGEKVHGVAKELLTIRIKGGKSSYTVSRVEYVVNAKSYNFIGPKNVLFEEGELVEIYYIKKTPKKATLASPQYFYRSQPIVNVICTIFMIFWMSLFFTYGIRYR
jgi:hypothetical protein